MEKQKKAKLMSMFFMGLGQIYSGFIIKGVIYAVIGISAFFNIGRIIGVIANWGNEYINPETNEIINTVTNETLKLNIISFTNIPAVLAALKGTGTLGEQVQTMNGFDIVQGDHSIFMLVEGIIVIFMILLFIGLYLINIFDAGKCARDAEKGIKQKKPLEYIKSLWNDNFFKLIITPGFVGILFLTVLPMVVTLCVAFTNYRAPDHIPPKNLVNWVGFENFKALFSMDIWNNTLVTVGLWTLIFAVATTFLNYAVGLIMALLLANRGIKLKGMWRTIFILPYAIPAFISALVMRLIFSGVGPVNTTIMGMGLDKIPFFSDPLMAKVSILIINCWLGAPYFMVLLSGAMTNISHDLYEAAEIDGAGKWSRFWTITLPMLLFQTVPVVILTFAYNFNNFGAIYLLTDGNPVNGKLRYAGETDIFISWVYKLTVDQRQFNMAAVISILLFIFIAVVAIINFTGSKSFKEEDMI